MLRATPGSREGSLPGRPRLPEPAQGIATASQTYSKRGARKPLSTWPSPNIACLKQRRPHSVLWYGPSLPSWDMYRTGVWSLFHVRGSGSNSTHFIQWPSQEVLFRFQLPPNIVVPLSLADSARLEVDKVWRSNISLRWKNKRIFHNKKYLAEKRNEHALNPYHIPGAS